MRYRPLPRAALLALLLALPAAAEDAAQPASPPLTLPDGTQLRPDDTARLAAFDQHFGAALHEALAGGSDADVDRLVTALRGKPMTEPGAAAKALDGNWRCQALKLGGVSPLIVYPNFACRFDGKTFEKTSGSQRMRGTVHAEGERLVYLGTGFVEGTEPLPYAGLPDDPLSGPSGSQIWSDVGLVEMVSANRGRIILPDPVLESRMNVLYLTR